MSDLKAPVWARAAQIGLGALAIILSIVILAFPEVALISVIFIVGILLLIVGIESVISGIFIKSRSRMASIGLGILVIILALIVITFPAAVGIFLLILIGIVLLIDGISRLEHGFGDKEHHGLSRAFRIGVGANCPGHINNNISWIWRFVSRHYNCNCCADSRDTDGCGWNNWKKNENAIVTQS